jgi:hypothetical protein
MVVSVPGSMIYLVEGLCLQRLGRSYSWNSFDERLFMSIWAKLGRFLEIYGPKF